MSFFFSRTHIVIDYTNLQGLDAVHAYFFAYELCIITFTTALFLHFIHKYIYIYNNTYRYACKITVPSVFYCRYVFFFLLFFHTTHILFSRRFPIEIPRLGYNIMQCVGVRRIHGIIMCPCSRDDDASAVCKFENRIDVSYVTPRRTAFERPELCSVERTHLRKQILDHFFFFFCDGGG